MKISKLEALKLELARLQKLIYDLERHGECVEPKAGEEYFRPSKYTSAVRRSSMDTTRALADLRRRKP